MSSITASIACGLVGRLLEAEAVGEGLEIVLVEPKRWPLRAARCAYRSSSSAAVSRTCCAALRLALSHWPLPSLCSGAASGCAPAVAADHVQLRDRHVELVAAVVLEQQELVAAFAQVEVDQALVAADAVLRVHHRIADA